MKRRRDFRLLPLLLIAVASLAVLKIAGLLLDGGYVLMGDQQPPEAVVGAADAELSGRGRQGSSRRT